MISALEGLGYECLTPRASDLLMGAIPEADLVVLDLIMPEIDGIEVLRALANGNSQAQVILMSGIARRVLETAEKTARVLGLRVMGHLQKPFRLAELWRLLEGVAEAEQLHDTVRTEPLHDAARTEPPILDAELQLAIQRNEFELYYQPQIHLEDHRVVGFEGLVRWKHPERGIVPPGLFIERIESLGLMEPLSWIVIRNGIRDFAKLSDQIGEKVTVSLNMSVYSLQDLSFPDQLEAMAELVGVSPKRIVIEITESGVVSKVGRSLDVLTRLRMKGICLSIDDFGTGYSMMEQLQNVPATELKIDRSFVAKMVRESSSRVMVEKIIELGHQLEMVVVAEGVETLEQMEFLNTRGCDVGQGYLFCRPIPIAEMKKWLGKEAVWRAE